MEQKLRMFQKNSTQRGITLVALVITIVILIILATIAIQFAFGENGLINRAQDAKEYYANDTSYTDESLANVESYINGIIGGTGTGGSDKSEVEEAIENGTEYASTTPIKDKFENTVYVPGGFNLAEDSGTSVGEGIVIEDASENQFVWIPTGTYKISASESKTNNLSRRTFTSTEATEVEGDSAISNYYGEGDSRSIAKDTIGAFLDSAKPVSEGGKGGFYIGRYEQGTGNVCKAGVEPYVSITRDTANTEAKAMYNGNQYVTSELISSYAWDTALNFICQTNSAGYTLAKTTDDAYGNIGTSNPTTTGEYEADKYNNICDFLGNRNEWTTEYYSGGGYGPCVYRGGMYNNSGYYAAFRRSSSTYNSNGNVGIRTQLYIK